MRIATQGKMKPLIASVAHVPTGITSAHLTTGNPHRATGGASAGVLIVGATTAGETNMNGDSIAKSATVARVPTAGPTGRSVTCEIVLADVGLRLDDAAARHTFVGVTFENAAE